MASLGVSGDPDGWLHAGGTMGSVIQQLEDELDAAEGSGGGGLRPHWYGPVADAYQDAWQQRRSRYNDLIGQARPAVSAISDFGHRMLDFQQRAADLESRWLHAGLVLTADGQQFTLPAHHASLPQELKGVFESLLGQSERDIAEMWRDIEGAARDLLTVLRSAASALEDFGLFEWELVGAEVAALAGFTKWTAGVLRKDLLREGVDYTKEKLEDDVVKPMVEVADKEVLIAKALSKEFYHHGNSDVRASLRLIKESANHDVKVAGLAEKASRWGGPVVAAVFSVPDGVQAFHDIQKHGVIGGLEQGTNVENLTDDALAIGLGVALAAGVGTAVAASMPALGFIAVSTVAIAGVGWTVQYGVDHRAAIAHGAEAAGHAAAKAVGAGVKDLKNLL